MSKLSRMTQFPATGPVALTLVAAALGFSACAPRQGGNEALVAELSGTSFTWNDRVFAPIPDTTPVAGADNWETSSGLKLYVKKSDVYNAKIQAEHPSRTFRNVNAGHPAYDKDGNRAKDKDGNYDLGFAPSKRGEIQGIVLRLGNKNVGLNLNCFRDLIPGSKEAQRCSDENGNRYLKRVYQDGDDYVFATTTGKEIARAKKDFADANVLGTFQDFDEVSQQSVSKVVLGKDVGVWGGRLTSATERYPSRSGCEGLPKEVDGVFTVPAPSAAVELGSGNIKDAAGAASCSLVGKSTVFAPLCIKSVTAPYLGSTFDTFCTKAVVVDKRDENIFTQDGGYGIFLVVKDESTAEERKEAAPKKGADRAKELESTAKGEMCSEEYLSGETSPLKAWQKSGCEPGEDRNIHYVRGWTQSGWTDEERRMCFKIFCAGN